MIKYLNVDLVKRISVTIKVDTDLSGPDLEDAVILPEGFMRHVLDDEDWQIESVEEMEATMPFVSLPEFGSCRAATPLISLVYQQQ